LRCKMSINLQMPDIRELKPRITVFGCGGGGGNAVNNMINIGLEGVDFVVANTDAQALLSSRAGRLIQMGVKVTEGLGAGSQPEVGRAAAEEVIDDIREQLAGAHMVFITAGMGGGTGTGAAPVVARVARELGILTVGVVTKPFQFEGQRRMRFAEAGIAELQRSVDTLIVIPNQNLFRIANEKTTFADAFALADQVLHSGVACITDLMLKEGLINLDFADVRAVMRDGGKAMMGTGEATGEGRAIKAAEAAIANPLLDESSMKGARGLLISVTGGNDLTLYEVDEAATRIRQEVDSDANIIMGATFDSSLDGLIRVSMVATGIDHAVMAGSLDRDNLADLSDKLRLPQTSHFYPTARVEAPSIVPTAKVDVIMPLVRPAPLQFTPIAQEVVAEQPVYETPVVQEEVILRPLNAGRPVYTREPLPQPEYQPEPQAYIPPEPVQQVQRPMPRVEDFPRHVQDHLEERKPISLLQRLTGAAQPRFEEQQRVSEPMKKPQAPNRTQDDYGRRAPAQNRIEEENYEIPAFLRRNAR
jgi:cell division protein FtsZ